MVILCYKVIHHYHPSKNLIVMIYIILQIFKIKFLGTSLVVQWLSLCTSTGGSVGSIPGRGTKIPHAMRLGQVKKENF